MTENEIKKALEHCSQHKCNCECPKYYDTTDVDICITRLIRSSLDLINRQKAEIEKLKEASEEAVSCFHRMESLYNIKRMELKVAKAEAIKEFAERIDTHFKGSGIHWLYEASLKQRIDNLVKEMVGED